MHVGLYILVSTKMQATGSGPHSDGCGAPLENLMVLLSVLERSHILVLGVIRE